MQLANTKGVPVKTMMQMGFWGTVGALLLLALPSLAATGAPDCQGCHEKSVHVAAYQLSAHKDLACTACHVRDAAVPLAVASTEACVGDFTKTDCARCHAKAVSEHKGSVHNGKRLPMDCARCHADIHVIQPHKTDKLAAARTCNGCHARQDGYFESAHYAALQKGHNDAPTCTDCHGTHAVAKVDNDAKGRDFHTKACLKCHDNAVAQHKNRPKMEIG